MSHLSHFFKVIVPLLEGPCSMQGLPNPSVLAEKGLAMVFNPVQHLGRGGRQTTLILQKKERHAALGTTA